MLHSGQTEKKNAGGNLIYYLGLFFTKESSINNYLHNTLLFSGGNTKLKKTNKEKHSLSYQVIYSLIREKQAI